MKATIRPGRALRGEVHLPGDKSISHRAAILASLAEGESCIQGFLFAGVTNVLLQSLGELGIRYEREGNALSMQGRGLSGYRSPERALNCGNSATTMRLLAGALAAAGVAAVLDGSAGLRRRPMRQLVEPLQAMGVPIEPEHGRAPLRIASRPANSLLRAIDYTLPVASAQIKSALIFAGMAGNGPTTLIEPSRSRDHTERMLTGMGADLEVEPHGSGSRIRIQPLNSRGLRPINRSIPGDFSSAAFLIVATLICPGSEVILREVGLNPTRTGFLEALMEMGADIQITSRRVEDEEWVGAILARHSRLRGTRVSGELVVRMIDEFPALAIAACYAETPTVVSQAEQLRHKESDRIADLSKELRSLSIETRESSDGFIVYGGKIPEGGFVEPHGDHRLAMALLIAGLAAGGPVILHEAQIVRESFPQFFDTLAALGADISIEN